ncbi:MAG: AAA family ATPase [Candidatus Sericytochromatia bacterium]
MKLHRLVLTNYRGISHREILLPDSGVIVVSGANEIGKSSMIEALDLLLEAKDRSTKKEVKQVKPTHADAGTEVEAEISSGAYRFVYRKRFHKRCETVLTVLAPTREQHSGDDAHGRVCAILAETVDTGLWRAQRVLQAASTEAVDLSGCDALSRALDVAAGQSAALCGDEPVLIDRIDTEYAQYFTPTGRPTGQWAAAIAALADAEEQVSRCADAVAEVDESVSRHAELSELLAELDANHKQAQQKLSAAREAAAAIAALTAELREAQVVSAAAQATADASTAAHAERRRLIGDVEERAGAIAGLEDEAAQAAEHESVAAEVCDVAVAAAEKSVAALDEAQTRLDQARSTFDRSSDRDELTRLTARLAKIDSARGELGRAEDAISANTVTDAVLRGVEVAAAAVEKAAALAEISCPRIELTAPADLDVVIGGHPTRLSAGETCAVSANAATDVEVPGVLRARVVPGAPASDTQATFEAAQRHLEDVLHAAGVTDVDVARIQAERRREMTSERDRLTATLMGLCGDDPVDELRCRLDILRTRVGAHDGGMDRASARAVLDAATEAHREAAAHCQRSREIATSAAAALADRRTAAAVLQEKLVAARAELEASRARLSSQRAEAGDERLEACARADAQAAGQAAARVADVRARLGEQGADEVSAALEDAEGHANDVARARGTVADEIRDLATQLRVYGTEGRHGRLDAAEIDRAHARREWVRIGGRARAVQLLRTVMLRHRDETRSRYVQPFRAEVERLGRIVFGDSFEVEIDSSLCICSRTLGGRTVPYESLSGGAKEQLGIVARLAGAALVAKEDSVPVIIDDALGFADSDRLAKMGAVFDAVGTEAQVLVLTCSPRRYDSVEGAHHIELTA